MGSFFIPVSFFIYEIRLLNKMISIIIFFINIKSVVPEGFGSRQIFLGVFFIFLPFK